MEEALATKKCPFCAETILEDARKCKHCGEIVDPTLRPQAPAPEAWNPGAAAVLSLFIPGAGQIYRGKLGPGLLWLFGTALGYVLLVLPGLVLHIICIVDAYKGDPRKRGG